MKKLVIISFVFLVASQAVIGQDKIQLYFNNYWEVTKKDKAAYIREADYDLQNFTLNGKVTDRDIKGKLVMEGNYQDGKKNGEFNFYYLNGHIESKGTYLNSR